MFAKVKSFFASAKNFSLSALFSAFFALFYASTASAGIGQDVVAKVESAATEANLVYVAVIAALAGFFIVKLIRKAL